jgi:predicted lipoprotein with Yx(FWY)xxD motif
MFTPRTRLIFASTLAASALLLASCGDDSSSGAAATTVVSGSATTAVASDPYGAPATTAAAATTTAAPTTAAPATTAAAAPGAASTASAELTLKLASTSLGNVLVDGTGHTLYVFTKDTRDKSNCTGNCLAAWPPLFGTPTAGAGVDASKLGSFTGADGKLQATIDGQPLYYYAPDAAVGDVKGQNVGTVWFVVSGAGTIIR